MILTAWNQFKPVMIPKTVKTPYQRYELTKSGISPRLIPGKSEHLVAADSHEHTESGHYSEDMELRKNMMDKRMNKMKLLEATVTGPEYFGEENPDIAPCRMGFFTRKHF